MKQLLMMIGIVGFIAACDELDTGTPGLLVPKTVDQDASLPSIAVNNTLLHAETFGDPNNSMLIFLHGGPGNDYRNGMAVKQLANDGYFVVFYDQRGSGLSKRHDKDEYSMSTMFDDLTGVIEHYRTSANQKVFLFGHSWGAMLAAGYINKYPNRISGAILAEPGGLIWDDVTKYVEKIRKIELFSETTSDVLYTDQFITGKENDHEVQDYKMLISWSSSFAKGNTEGVEGPFPVWRFGSVVQSSLFELGEEEGLDFTTNLDQYTTPVLLLYSENNKSYGLSHAQKQAAYFPNAEVVQVDDTGHEMIYFKWNTVYPLASNYLNSLN